MEFKDIQDDLRNMKDDKYSSYRRRDNNDNDVFHYTCIMVFQQGVKPPLPVPLDGDLPLILASPLDLKRELPTQSSKPVLILVLAPTWVS